MAIDTKTNELTFLTRSFLRRDKFLLTFVDEFNLSRKTLTRYDFMIGYLTKDVDFFIRHYSVANPKIKCCTAFGVGRILLNFVTRRNATSFGGELEVKGNC